MSIPQPQGIPRPSWDTESLLLRFWGTEKKFQSDPAPLAKNTAHPKSFAAKSIIIITCGDEFPMMVAGPQQPPLIMTFCSCWQSLPVRWLIPNSQRVRQSTHTILGPGLAARKQGGQRERRLKGRLHLWEGRSVQSSQHVTFNVIICDILIQVCFVAWFSDVFLSVYAHCFKCGDGRVFPGKHPLVHRKWCTVLTDWSWLNRDIKGHQLKELR